MSALSVWNHQHRGFEDGSLHAEANPLIPSEQQHEPFKTKSTVDLIDNQQNLVIILWLGVEVPANRDMLEHSVSGDGLYNTSYNTIQTTARNVEFTKTLCSREDA